MSNGKWILISGPDPSKMNWETIAGVRIFRPRHITEVHIRNQSEAHLRAKCKPGIYKDSKAINEVIQRQFEFYSGVLTGSLEKIASREFMEFLLHQYDLSSIIEQSMRGADCNHLDRQRWFQLGPMFRRTIKYLAERLVLLAPEEAPKSSKEALLGALDEAWICSEEIVRLYILSAQTHSLFPNDTQLIMEPPGEMDYFKLTVSRPEVLQFEARIRSDTASRLKYVPEDKFLYDIDKHDAILGDAMRKYIGIGYKDAIGIVNALIQRADPNGSPVPFVRKEMVVEMMERGGGLSRAAVEAALDGFSITKARMLGENRVIWKPKQEYRAFRRAFFEFPHPTGSHLVWSKKMAEESLMRLLSEIVFKKLPPEWSSSESTKGIEKISNAAGKWFESVCADNLKKLGFQGTRSFKDEIGMGDQRLEIPDGIGELDCLGYSPTQELLLLAECKLVRSGFEPAFFRDDVSKFVGSSTSYAEQLRRKATWVQTNHRAICASLESVKEFPSEIKPKRIAWVMITYFPNIASYMMGDFPCVSITELMMAYEQEGEWPFDTGIVNC